ncbi:HutD family protein [Nocardioides sp. B-3]|nr:HutD family protein [Nocardioides sp. B-3]UUZ58495.1 HutD family protein [Nocardioides sp. B-3]
MSVVRRSAVAPQPWANGGGTTRELLVADDGARRISLADIEQDGPFSSFPGRATAHGGRRLGAGAGRRRRRAGRRAAPSVRLRRRRGRDRVGARGAGGRPERDRRPGVGRPVRHGARARTHLDAAARR